MLLRFLFIALIGWQLMVVNVCLGQSSQDDELLILAENKFNNQDFGGALKIYLDLETRQPKSAYLKYKTGLCFLNSPNQKINAVEYLVYSLSNRSEKVPAEVYYYLGKCYHLLYRFDEAIANYEAYMKEEESNRQFGDAGRQVEMCHYAKLLMEQPEKAISVEILGPPVNSSYNDYGPVVRPNGGLLLFSSDRNTESVDIVFGDQYVFLPEELQSPNQDVFQSYPRGIDWDYPYPQALKGNTIIPLSLREQGSELLLYWEEDKGDGGDLCISKHKGSRWGPPKKLGSRINSRYDEQGGCFVDNGKVLYFASNRPGGYGGYDIYAAYAEGRDWGKPINLGPTINTPYDEVSPFMLSDEKTLYFSSSGHNSMGGLDIFMAIRIGEDDWITPKNLGYPINSPYDDNHFVQITDGKQSFFSSNRAQQESIGGEDIIGVYKIEKENPMAIVKGIITVEREGQRLPVTLEVFDKYTHKKQKYVYNPDEETGKYFMILTPRKNYEIRIDAGLGDPYVLDIDVPEDTYSYELNKSIQLNPVMLYGKVIGDRLVASEDSFELKPIYGKEDIAAAKYDALVLLMDRIVDAQDRQQLESLNELDNQGILAPKVGPDPYYTPIINRIEKALEMEDINALRNLGKPDLKKEVVFKGAIKDSRKLVATYKVAFKPNGKMFLAAHPDKTLEEIIVLLQDYRILQLEVVYSVLSAASKQEQAKSVYQYFSSQDAIKGEKRIAQVKSSDMGTDDLIELRIYEDHTLLD